MLAVETGNRSMQGDYYYVYVDTVHSLRDGYRQQAIDMDFEHDAGEGGR